MARIPTIIAESRLDAGPVGPYADANTFSAGAAGLYDFGQGIANAGTAIGQIARKQKLDDDNRWFAKASAQYDAEATTFLHDPENANREDYYDIGVKFLADRQAEYLKQAPSSNAQRRFKEMADRYANANRASLLNQTNRIKLENTKNEVATNVNNVMGAFRGNPDKTTAAINAELQRETQHRMVDEIFTGLAPNVRRSLHEYIDDQFILGVADGNSNYARRILNESKFIDEGRRKTLESHIDQVEQSGLRMAQFDFETTVQRSIEKGFENNSIISKPSKAVYLGLYGKENGELAWKKDSNEIDEANTAIAFSGTLNDKNAAAITRQVNEFRKNANVPTRLKNLVSQKANDLIRMQAEDSAGFLVAGNDEVHSAFTAFQADGTAKSFQKYVDLVRKYQGRGPDDRYLGIPTNAQHALPAAMATQLAGEMNRGSFEEKLQALQRFGSMFESYDAWKVGFNDLVTLPKQGEGVKPQYQLALQFLQWKDGQVSFRNPEFVRGYLSAVDNQEILKDIGKNKEKYTDYVNRLDSNPQWRDWVDSVFYKDNRAGDLLAAKEGILAYAWANGKNSTDAVRDAVQKLIGDNNYVATVSGQPLPMGRFRKDGSQRTEAELEDITRRLGVSPKYLDVDQIDTSRLYFAPLELGGSSRETRFHLLRYVLAEGFFVPEGDGNSVTLHVMSDGGNATQLTDRKGNPFRIHFDNLPNFTYTRTQVVESGAAVEFQPAEASYTKEVTVKEQPSKTLGDESPAFPAWQDDEATNWPVRDWTIKQSEWQEYRDTFWKMMQNRPAPVSPNLPMELLRDLTR